MTPYELKGKIALVTGAGRGIGLETARSLHARGASVALVDLDESAAREGAESVGARAIGLGADVTDADAVTAAAEAVVDHHGGLDVCVANAGIASAAATVRSSNPRTFERVVEVNLLGTYRTVMAALPHVIERRGHLSIVASAYAFFNGALVAPYAVSKAGVEQLGRALRVELVPRGVSVGVAYFGFIATELVRQGFEADPLAARLEQEIVPGFARRRIGAPEAAEALVRGVERRAPRVFAPAWVRGYFLLHGLINPLLDWRMERHPAVRTLLPEADVEGRTTGREIVAAREADRPPQPDVR